MSDVIDAGDVHECVTCGHEWAKKATDDDHRVVKDANGNVLQDGDTITLTKSLKVKGAGTTLKVGTKVKNIRLVSGDHEIDCKVDGRALMLKAMFVKKA